MKGVVISPILGCCNVRDCESAPCFPFTPPANWPAFDTTPGWKRVTSVDGENYILPKGTFFKVMEGRRAEWLGSYNSVALPAALIWQRRGERRVESASALRAYVLGAFHYGKPVKVLFNRIQLRYPWRSKEEPSNKFVIYPTKIVAGSYKFSVVYFPADFTHLI